MEARIAHVFDDRDWGWVSVMLAGGCPTPGSCAGAGAGSVGCPTAEALRELAVGPPSPHTVWLLSEVDRSRLSGPELVLMTTALARAQTWLAAITEDTLLEVDARAQARADAITDELVVRGVQPERGAAHPDAGREEIGLALRVSPRSAQGRLDRARQLRDQTRYPGLAGLLAAGLTSHGHAAALISALDGLPDGLCATVVAHHRVQARLLRSVPWQVATTAVQIAARLRDPAAAEHEHTQARDRRSVRRDPLPDGMAQIVATLTAEDAAALMARLQRAVAQARELGDARTADQVRADALAALGWHGHQPTTPDQPPTRCNQPAHDQPAHDQPAPPGPPAQERGSAPGSAPGSCPWCGGGPVDPCVAVWAGRVVARVQVTMSIESLLALTDDPARLSTDGRSAGSTEHGWTPAATARMLLTQPGTEWQRFLHDQTGLLLGVSRAHQIPEQLRRLALARYTRCTFPGCTRTHSRETARTGADLDHAVPWQPADLGPGLTHIGNIHPADRRHHQLHTHHGWTPTIDPHTGAVTWTSPWGQTSTTDPDWWHLLHHDPDPDPEPDPPPPPASTGDDDPPF